MRGPTKLPARLVKLAGQIMSGLDVQQRRTDSWVLRDERHIVAEVLVRPRRGVRVNLMEPLGSAAPPAVKKLFQPPRGTGHVHHFAYVEPADAEVARLALSLAQGKSLTPRLDKRAWTKREDKLVLAHAETDAKLAERLGRTRQSVASRRHALTNLAA